MAISPEFRDHVLDLLEPLGTVSARAMFGGAGIFLDGRMFALVSKDVLYFKVDDENRGDYEAAGMEQFGRMPYFQVPIDVMEDPDAIGDWARGAYGAAVRADGKKGKKRS